jgi:hypothetical protein
VSESSTVVFKVASETWEFEQIHKLNYQTFVDEIPQHQPNAQCRLVDRFHGQDTYLIAVCGRQLLGMISLRDTRPLSLDEKLGDLENFLPAFDSILEYRLLAIREDSRHTLIFKGIMKKAFDMAFERAFDIAVISATTRQTRLYRHLGFKPFGPLVGTPGAHYQPMYIDLATAVTLKKKSRIL